MKIKGEKVYLSLGEILKLGRIKKGYTVSQVADILGVIVNTVYSTESDKHIPKIGVIYQMCKMYDLNLDLVCKIAFDNIPLDANEIYDIQ